MSCFLVSNNHISAIISYACRDNLKAGWSGNPPRYSYQPGFEQAAADILYAANVKSVNDRYGETHDTTGCVYNAMASVLRPIEVIKLCDCLAYQCSDADDFEGSDAQKLITDIQRYAIRNLPGYEAAQWDIA